MKKLAYYLSGAIILIGGSILTSCNDALDAESKTEKNTTNFPKTESDATQALAAIYQNLNKVNANPQASFFYVSMLASDDNYGGGGTNDKLMQAEDLLLNYQTNMTQQFWIDRYEGINRANTLLASITNITLSDNDKNQIVGEANFLRAFYYYELCSQYGNVPLVLTPENQILKPATAAAEWGQILQDLRDAAKNMPATKNSDGHVDKYTAEAMLGRAWLFYTGMYCNGETLANMTSTTYSPLTTVSLPDGSTLTKEDVAGYLEDCANNSGYSLVPDFRNLWAYTNRCSVEEYSYTKGKNLKWVEDDNAVNPESMFAIKFNKLASWSTTIGYANGYALHFGVRGGQDYSKTFPFGQGWGAGPVASNLVNDWETAEPNDMRRDASVQNVNDLPAYTRGGWSDYVQETDYYEKKLSPISCKNPGGLSGDLANVVKYPYLPCFENLMYGDTGWTQNSNNMQLNNIHDLVLIRFADVLLMHSELTDGKTLSKYGKSGLNAVRERAGLSDVSYSLSALQNERRWELAFEGTRWNDIRRWHIAAAALEKQTNQPVYYCGNSSTNTAHAGGYAARYNATAGFFKIPEGEISLSKGTLTQRDGWTGSDSEYNGWK